MAPNNTILTNSELAFWQLPHVKHQNNNAKNCFPFSNYIRDSIKEEEEEMMVLSDASSLYKSIPLADTLNIMKDCVNNKNQFTRKTPITQNKFRELINLVLTTSSWHTYNSQLFQETDYISMRGLASSITGEIYKQVNEETEISTTLHHP